MYFVIPVDTSRYGVEGFENLFDAIVLQEALARVGVESTIDYTETYNVA